MYVALAILELTDPFLCLLNADIKCVYQYAQLLYFKINSKSRIFLLLMIAILSKVSSGTAILPPLTSEVLPFSCLSRMPLIRKMKCACAQGPALLCELMGHSLQVAVE